MNTKYIIGIDAGTQSSKVSIFDLQGNRICSSVQRLQPLHMPKPGVAEHPNDDLWDSIAVACKAVMRDFPYSPQNIIGVGLCTIRCCRVVLDEDGILAEPALNWMDVRVGEVYNWQNPNARYLTTSSGYITHRMTGEKKDTAANYEGQWPLDKNSWQWTSDTETLQRYKVTREQLFELCLPGEVLGKVTGKASEQTGLPLGLPVVATANDKAVEALGSGLQANDTALISLGTYIGGMVVGDQHVEQSNHYFSNLACIPNHYLYESGGVRHGMGTVSWLRDLVGDSLIKQAEQFGISPEELLNQEAAGLAAGSDGLVTLPEWLAPYNEPHKRGVMLGFHAGHQRGHLYKSLLEAIALTMKNHLHNMCQELDRPLNKIVISGGGSNSDVFMQILADVFGLTTQRNHITDAASLGSAMCVAVALNEVDSFAQAMQNMVKPALSFTPNPASTKFYQALNERVFKRIDCHTDSLLRDLYCLDNFPN